MSPPEPPVLEPANWHPQPRTRAAARDQEAARTRAMAARESALSAADAAGAELCVPRAPALGAASPGMRRHRGRRVHLLPSSAECWIGAARRSDPAIASAARLLPLRSLDPLRRAIRAGSEAARWPRSFFRLWRADRRASTECRPVPGTDRRTPGAP